MQKMKFSKTALFLYSVTLITSSLEGISATLNQGAVIDLLKQEMPERS